MFLGLLTVPIVMSIHWQRPFFAWKMMRFQGRSKVRVGLAPSKILSQMLHVGVSKNRGGKHPKMDGENNGKPY